jgi:hypothetical protein
LVALQSERWRCCRSYLDMAIRSHGGVDPQGVSTLQRDWIHNRLVSLIQWLLAHAIQTFHGKNVEIVALSERLGNLQSLLPCRVDQVAILNDVTLFGHKLLAASHLLLKFLAIMERIVRIHICYLFMDLSETCLDVHHHSVWTIQALTSMLPSDHGVMLPGILNSHHF